MVDLSNIGRNLGTENIAAAFSGAQKTKEVKKKERKTAASRGLGLEDIPDAHHYVNVDEVEEAEAPVEENILDKIDNDLEELQFLIKDVLARKIKLADKHEDRRHELLISAFNDCKNAYLKVKAVRDNMVADNTL